jgi:hypothetical protein
MDATNMEAQIKTALYSSIGTKNGQEMSIVSG